MGCLPKAYSIIMSPFFLKQFLQGKFHYLFLWNDAGHMFLLAAQGMVSSAQVKLCRLPFINMSLNISNYCELFT